MKRKQDNRGVTLIELIVVIAIMAVLGVVVAISVTQFIERAKHVSVENEAVQFAKAADIAYVEAVSSGNAPSKTVQYRVSNAISPYYQNGKGPIFGRVTTYTFWKGIDVVADNNYFNETFYKILKMQINPRGGATWTSGSAQVPVSEQSTLDTQKASMDDKCRFQAFYDSYGNMIIEYSRNGYFVRVEGGTIVMSEKADKNKDYFSLVNKKVAK